MPTEIQRRGGTTAEHTSFTGAAREITVDTDKNTLVVHDGSTAGGFPLAKSAHVHSLDDISASGDGVWDIFQGGTGASTAETALANLENSASSLFKWSVSAGGTGASTAVGALTNLGAASAAHVHTTDTLTGFSSNIVYISTQAEFDAEYVPANVNKTIVVGGGTYTVPGSIIPNIHVFNPGSNRGVTFSGTLQINVSTVATDETVWSNISINGDIVASTLHNGKLVFRNARQTGGTVIVNASTIGEMRFEGGQIEKFAVSQGSLETHGTDLTDGGSTLSDGKLEIFDMEADLDSANDLITITGGSALIVTLRWFNDQGNGIVLNEGELILDQYFINGSVATNALSINGTTASSILTIGNHNLPFIVSTGGTIQGIRQEYRNNSIRASALANNAVTQNKIANSAIQNYHLDSDIRDVEYVGTINQVITSTFEVVHPYFNKDVLIKAVHMQTNASANASCLVSFNQHDPRIAGSGITAASVLASGISIGQPLSSTYLGASILTGGAFSLQFNVVNGSTALEGVMYSFVAERL